MITKMLSALKSTTKKIDKEKILKGFDCDLVREYAYYTFNNDLKYNVKAYDISNPPGPQTIENAWDIVKGLLNKLNDRKYTGNAAIAKVNLVRGLLDKESQEAFDYLFQRDWKAGVSKQTINKVFKNIIPDFSVALAATYDEKKQKLLDEGKWVISRKIDGCVSYDTLVTIETGEDVKIGDVVTKGIGKKVLSYNIKTKEAEYKDIIGRSENGDDVNEYSTEWFEIELENGNKIEITGNDRLWCDNLKCWRRVDNLDGDEILLTK